MRYRSEGLLVRATCPFLVLTVALASAAEAQSKKIEISQPFDYPSLAIGPQLRDVLVLRPSEEDDAVSRFIVSALQSLQHSLVDAPKLLGRPLAPDRDYAVEIAQLSEDDVREHNEKFPSMRLPTSAHYGVSYSVRYTIQKEAKNRRLLVLLVPMLHHRATGSHWREYRRGYSGEFLAARVVRAISGQFAEALKEQAPK